MVYIERTPHPALSRSIQSFWYARDPLAAPGLERVLPSGYMQVVINLARDYLTDCRELLTNPCGEGVRRRSAAAIVTGMRSRYDLIDRSDMEELIGVIFRAGGTAAFFPCNAAEFAGGETALEDVWGRCAETLRDRMREAKSVEEKFNLLEGEFLARLKQSPVLGPTPAVSLALAALTDEDRISVREISRQTGLSTRRLSEIFREQVGVSPKIYLRIMRFQRAVQQMHRGTDIRWMDLALECGYYDQSHFVNEFHEFSGICPTAYSATARMWSNHLPLD